MIEVKCHSAPWSGAIEFAIFDKSFNGIVSVVRSMTMETLSDDGSVIAPLFSLEHTEAQLLIDELWHCGLRPSEGTGSAGSLAATKFHLEDMRAIAMGLLRKDGLP